MIKICLKCQKEFSCKKETAKFCSDSCRVMFNQKNKKIKSVLAVIQNKVLIDTILEKLNQVNFVAIELGSKNEIHKTDGKLNISLIADPKSVVQYVQERMECEDAETYNNWLKILESDNSLSKKEKQTAKTAIL